MSNFASSCPHCGRQNSAAPQTVLRDPAPLPRPIQAKAIPPTPMPKAEERDDQVSPPASDTGMLIWAFQWFRELGEEWRNLDPQRKSAAQILFSLAALTAVGFGVYMIVA